jgi:RHS repeat-associated protein
LAVTELQLTGLHSEKRTYDAQGKMTSLRSQNRETTFNYGANGYLASMTGPMGLTITYARDALGRVTEVQRPDNSRVSFTYDGNGNMLMLTNPDNNDHDFDYNSVDKPSAYHTPMSGSYSFAYDAERKLTRVGFPSGQKINSVYDKGRLISLETPEGSIDYAYALCGNKVERISRGGNTLSYAYDGPLVISRSLKGLLDEELSFSYDSDFRIRDFTYAGQTEGIAYDRDGLLTSSGEFSIARNDGNGLPEKVEDGYYVESRSFNGFGEIDQRQVRIAGSEVYASDLTRNQAGQIAQKRVTVNGQTRSYGYSYDDLGRLSEVTRDGLVVEDYDYAADGTRIFDDNHLRDVSRSLSFDAEDRLLTAGSAQYQFDADGFLTKKTIGSNSTLYDYSSRGELLRVDLPGGTSIEYTYDPLGRRIARAVNGTITRKYLWQGLTRLLAVYDGSSRPLMRFEYADGRMPVAMTKGASRYYLIYDQVGSLRLVADNVGNIVKDLDYDSFGNVIRDTNPSFEIPFGFAGGLFDKDTGLIRFGRRDYDPDSGRWTAKDPILFAGGDINLYGYCLNDPVNLVDPEGQFGLAGAVVGLVAGAYGGFLGGIQSDNVYAGIVGGLAGAGVGTAVGAVLPSSSSIIGGVVGGSISGAFGGGTGGIIGSLVDKSPCKSIDDVIAKGKKGAMFGGITGAIGGSVSGAALSLGASEFAAEIAASNVSAPIGWGLAVDWNSH